VLQYEHRLQDEEEEKIKYNAKNMILIDKIKNDLERESKK
jgi:hypothetical protein